MATFTEHEDFHGKSIAFQLNKISCMCQADASDDTHNTTTHNNNNSEYTVCMFCNVFKHVITCNSNLYPFYCYYLTFQIYHNWFIHSLAGGHLGCL